MAATIGRTNPITAQLTITTSWDDGHPSDMRLAELLAHYGIAGTFYVPLRNSEGRPVLSSRHIVELSHGFEMGGHTVDHVNLLKTDPRERRNQVANGKRRLEDILGHEVAGFCYPQGAYDRSIRDITEAVGFKYARTTQNLVRHPHGDAFQLPTTIQFFPHQRAVYVRNLIRQRADLQRLALCVSAVSTTDLEQRTKGIVDIIETKGGHFHLWGHSWELDEHDLWEALASVLRHLSTKVDKTKFLTNQQLVALLYP